MKVENNKNESNKNIKKSKQSDKDLETITEDVVNSNNDLNEKESMNQPSEVKEIEVIIKNNKGKCYNNGLKIESVGNEPIFKSDISKRKPAVNSSEANLKRLQSLVNLKKTYKNQKTLIQAALSKVDTHPKNKIVFEDNENSITAENFGTSREKKSKKNLFDDSHPEDEEFEVNFAVKEQFLGKKGQKLLELQSKYKNDKRFVLDSRFLDSNEIDDEVNNEEGNEEKSLEEEKKKEYEILEQVLGKNILKSQHKNELESTQKKAMLRFDPMQPEHSKFEIKNEVEKKKKRKRSDAEAEMLNKKRSEDKELPEVSKDKFYKVTNNLKESLHEKEEFSLLSMFGKTDEKEDQNIEEYPEKLSTKNITNEKNPFKYDSSDDEDETAAIPNKEDIPHPKKSLDNFEVNTSRKTYWTEPFFFKYDDYRLQEGFDFIEKMKSEEKADFSKLRRDLKEIVKAKVRNNQRKHKPFKKKLGGNKKKKILRMKKALKR